jgi:hypothetical protein
MRGHMVAYARTAMRILITRRIIAIGVIDRRFFI